MLPQTHTLHTPLTWAPPGIHTYKHTYTETHIYTHRGAHEHIYKKTYVQAHAWTQRHTYPTCASPLIDTHTDIYAHRHIENRHTIQAPPTYRHTNTDTHTHTGTHMHPLSRHTQRHTLGSLRTSASCLPLPSPP